VFPEAGVLLAGVVLAVGVVLFAAQRSTEPPVPGPLLTAHRPRRDGRPYDTHVLPGGCPDAAPMPSLRPVDLDMLPELTAESGRGLFLIHALTDHVRLRNHPLRGAIVSFDKILKWQDDALLRAAS
ncbi:hypothetical protein ACWC5I_17970, partial [Kitasatospora sp. NPDC001574]